MTVTVNGIHVRIGKVYGLVLGPDSSRAGNRHWLVEWDSGKQSVHNERELVNVDIEEWDDALDGVPFTARCRSFYGEGNRSCSMRKGHRTLLHWSGEVSWSDEMTRIGA
jgi:hypothetical protein